MVTSAQRVIEARNLIAGRWEAAGQLDGRRLRDPNDGSPFASMSTTSPEAVDRALRAADDVHRSGSWRRTGPQDRADILEHIATALEARLDDLAVADSLSSGVPIGATRRIADFVPARFRASAMEALRTPWEQGLLADGRDVRVLTLPWGPAAVLTPWNAPSFIAGGKIASALAAGCPVVWKPSEWAQPSAQVLAEAIASSPLPPGVFQVVHGAAEVGNALATDDRVKVLSFTGGQAAGRSIARAAAEDFKHLQLELGGNNPVLVLADADIAATARSIAQGITTLNGQWCEGPGKVIAHASIADELTRALVDELRTLTLGHSLDADSDVGPLSNEDNFRLVQTRINSLVESGATVITTAAIPDLPGYFLSPTIVIGADLDAATEELFGPVVSMHAVASDEDALVAANRHPSGLDAYVYGAEDERTFALASEVVAGEVRINGARLSDLGDGSAQSFWGPSGIGGHGPAEASRVFCGVRVVGFDDPASQL